MLEFEYNAPDQVRELLRRHAGRVVEQINAIGQSLQGALDRLIAETGLPVTLSPCPSMPFLYFDRRLANGQYARRDRFYAALSAAEVFRVKNQPLKAHHTTTAILRGHRQV